MTNTLFDALMEMHRESERDFLILPDGDSLSYQQVHDLSGQMANELVQLGVMPGDRVAVQVEKSPEALALYLATLRVGAVFLPLNTAYTATEVAYFIGDARPALVICDPAKEPQRDQFMSPDATLRSMGADGQGSFLQGAFGPICDASPDGAQWR